MSEKDSMRERALRYHSHPTPGKVALSLTTAANSADDLALAYSPGVSIRLHLERQSCRRDHQWNGDFGPW
jgi:malic enzyme